MDTEVVLQDGSHRGAMVETGGSPQKPELGARHLPGGTAVGPLRVTAGAWGGRDPEPRAARGPAFGEVHAMVLHPGGDPFGM